MKWRRRCLLVMLAGLPLGSLAQAAVSNDQSNAATPAGGLPFTARQSIAGATASAGDPVHSCTGSADSQTVWFSYTAGFTGNLMVDTELAKTVEGHAATRGSRASPASPRSPGRPGSG